MRRQFIARDPGRFEPHDHVSWMGRGDDDLYSLAVRAFSGAAMRNDQMVFVADTPDPSRLSGVPRVDELLASGQLTLARTTDVYGDGAALSAVLEAFEALLADAIASGYRAIAVVADNTAQVIGDDASFSSWLAWEQMADRFQDRQPVTGVCFFDRTRLTPARLADLAALHPVRCLASPRPDFQLFRDEGVVRVSGTLDAGSAERFRRLIAATPVDGEVVIDLADTDFADHRVLVTLNAQARLGPAVRVVNAPRTLRRLHELIGPELANVRIE